MEIKNRFTGEIIFQNDCETIRECVICAISMADLSHANLSGADLSGADLSGADLSGANIKVANLSGADLSGANLSGADLSGADLSEANLSGADLSGANLKVANLSHADLSEANLSGADLDYSCLPLQCASLKVISDKRLRVQIAFHFLSLIKNGKDVTDEEKKIYNDLIEYANKFHRCVIDVKKLESI